MIRRGLLALLLVAAWSATVHVQQPAPNTPETHAVDPAAYTDPRQFSFLTPLLKDVEVVSLGESIHFTHEFPLVRLGIIKHLNEQMGFHVLALEGSSVDIWATQDRLLNSARTDADVRDAQQGFFAIWTTPEVRQLVEYETRMWSTKTPLYIAAYDIQPGTGEGTRGTAAFSLLAARLRTYAPPPDGFDESAWTAAIGSLARGCNNYEPSDRGRVTTAIDQLAQWIDRAAPVVASKFPDVPHAAALRLMPENLKASLGLCTDLPNAGKQSYKGTRDTHAAEYTFKLKAAVPGERLMLWAHLSHVFHNAEGKPTSVGQKLHEALGSKLYTIMPLAEGGRTILIYDDTKDDIGYGRVDGIRGELTRRLSQLGSTDYFVDLRQPALASDPLFTTPQPIFVESTTWNLALARDVDAVIWIKRVSTPELPLGKRLLFGSLHYATEFAVAAGLLLILLIATPFYIWIRRRRRARRIESAPVLRADG